MKRFIVYASFSIVTILSIWLFALNAETAGNLSISLVLLFSFLGGAYFRGRDLDLSRIAVFALSSIGIIIYTALLFILNPKIWYSAPPFCLLVFLLGFVTSRKYLLYAMLPTVVASVFFAFWFYPQKSFLQNKIDPTAALRTNLRIDLSLQLIDDEGNNCLDSMLDKVVLLETWNQYCGVCFEAMKDLHPFLRKMEAVNSNFKHYYVYTNNSVDENELEKYAFKNKRLPYGNMRVLYDKDQMLYKKSNEQGVPQFFFIGRDGEVKHLSIGYESNFSTTFKIFIKKTVSQLMDN